MSNSQEQQNIKIKKIRPFLLLSGLIVAVSYFLLLIPFALYSLSQVSAMLGKRYMLLVALCVFVVLLLLSLLLGNSILFSSAALLFVSLPCFLIAIIIREKLWSKTLACITLSIPFLIGFSSFLFLPRLDNNQFHEAIAQVEQNILVHKQEVQKQIRESSQSSPETQLLLKYDEAIEQIKTLENVKELKEFLAYNVWQRISCFVFGFSSIFFFFALLVTFSNIIFLDLAYEQIEKLKAIIAYVSNNVTSFSSAYCLALNQLPILKNKIISDFFIVKHDALNSTLAAQNLGQSVKIIKLGILKNSTPKNRIILKGYSFLFEGKLRSWNLKNFSLPLVLAVFPIAFMILVMFWFGGTDQLITSLETSSFSPFIAMGSLTSFVLLSILTLQGLFTFYLRVSNLFGLLFLLILLILGSNFSISYYAILAIFGSIALLDYVYDWRQKHSVHF